MSDMSVIFNFLFCSYTHYVRADELRCAAETTSGIEDWVFESRDIRCCLVQIVQLFSKFQLLLIRPENHYTINE